MKQKRNLSVNAYFENKAAQHVPEHRFDGKTKQDFQRWQSKLRPKVLATMGKMPAKVPLNPETIAEWTEDGVIKRKVIFDVEDGLSATCYVFRPENAKGKLPAIMCCHGHGQYGKEGVMGNRGNADLRTMIPAVNYDYGLQMAKAGFVTIAIDWRGFGDRCDNMKPHHQAAKHVNRDICNLHYLRATILGMSVLGMNVHDGMCALDYLCQQDFVDTNRIGCMGCSFGGTMTTWLTICDPRIKAADIICYSDRFADFGMRDINFCGSQITPGVYEVADLPDLHGLIAPRPLLVEIGAYDDCFLIESAMSCYKEVEKIYAAAGAKDKLVLDLFDGGHKWADNKCRKFFTDAL